ncbi:LANO_0B03004g1_1 [Lachancea nothofagi CBS 11611]|uniref:LANO_0B03004g1_1 n=1 Tax=Lachancea nothofagi CBS 11611 TaxID=1266666 RepID=A0A1G4IWG2_9SACH|nr:LANO_0B03004g1_1 [Lachancea nothofagi CBS 11611]
MGIDEQQLLSFQRYLSNAKKVLCIVGAGMSASSGIPTYQWQRGSWNGYTSLDLATPEAFHNDPGLVWLFYSSRRAEALRAKPNNGHFALAEFCRRFPSGVARKRGSSAEKPAESNLANKQVLVVSQNVDGLHQRAGHPSESLVELHGSVFGLKCTQFFCNYRSRNDKDRFLTPALHKNTPRDTPTTAKKRRRESFRHDEVKNVKKQHISEEAEGQKSREISMTPDSPSGLKTVTPFPTLETSELPMCPDCHSGLLRPAVVWFGESLPLTQMDEVDRFFNVGNPVDLVLVIGSSGKVWPAMGYVERAKKSGSKVAIFNTVIEDLDQVRKSKDIWGFEGDAAQILPGALKPLIGDLYKPRNWQNR